MNTLVVEGLSKNFGSLRALDQVSLAVPRGQRRVIIGPNGAGKTTLLHLITGLHAPSEGRVFLFGRDVTRMPIHSRSALGMARTFQVTNLFQHLTILESVLLSLLARDRARFIPLKSMTSYKHLLAKAQGVLERWSLWEKRDVLVGNLSHGDQRQIELVMALSQEPQLLLLDEPTAGLAAAETAMVTAMIQALPADLTVLLIEHNLDVAFQLAEEISVLHVGRVLMTGSRDEVKANPQVQEVYLGPQG